MPIEKLLDYVVFHIGIIITYPENNSGCIDCRYKKKSFQENNIISLLFGSGAFVAADVIG